jgi:hypothetical protein
MLIYAFKGAGKMITHANRFAPLILVVIFSIDAQVRAVSYTATLLHPEGAAISWGMGASSAAQVGFGILSGVSNNHALMWMGDSASVVDLNPIGITSSRAISASVIAQVGFGSVPSQTGSNNHAFMWSGSAESAVDLHPADYEASFAEGVSNTTQVGYGWKPNEEGRALMWSGSAASVVDLHPLSGFGSSEALGVSGGNQVGYGLVSNGSSPRALLWSGTAESVVNLQPSNYAVSTAAAVRGDVQVGYATKPAGKAHAVMWHGTAASIVDLNPAGFDYSEAKAISAAGQVGDGRITATGDSHALYWNNTAASAVDLHSFLSGAGRTFGNSRATGINDDGVIVGYAYDVWNVDAYAVMWTPNFIPGDFNRDDKVDALDYVTWRKGLGTTYTQDDYSIWRSHFGQSSGGTALLPPSAVPEPAGIVVSVLGVIGQFWSARRRRD